MKLRFLGDWDLNHDIVAGVIRREPEIDFKTGALAQLAGLPDSEVLALAAAEGRILVTHDRSSMPRHFARFIEQSHSPGVVIVSQQLAVRQAIEDLLVIWHCSAPEDWVDVLDYLPL